jgi:NAD(P)-dependent dehydrogenase (short-subunit alcohol dehydrogenase family)
MNDVIRGKTVLVTGSTDGIGRETALGLSRMGANVLVHGRDRVKGAAVLNEISRLSGKGNLELFIADLSSQRQVRSLAQAVLDNHDRLDVLINNAGVFEGERRLTEDGLELTFAVNYMAPFLLTNLLLDLLKKSAPSRIISVASIAHRSATVDWNNLLGERYYDSYEAYNLSKLCVVLFTYALAERLNGTRVTANCLHPGVIKTKLLREGFGDYPGDTPEKGARTSIYLASSQEMEGVSGKYFERQRMVRSSEISYDKALQERLWKLSERLSALA